MKKAIGRVFLAKYSAAVFAFVSAVSALINYSYRVGYVFVDKSLFRYFSFSMFIISVIFTAFLFIAAALRLKSSDKCSKTAFCVIQLIAEVYGIVFLIVDIVNIITGGSESFENAFGLMKEALPLWLGVVLLAAALFIIPNIANKKSKTALTVISALAAAFAVYAALLPVSPFKFTSAPVVFDNGESYSVAFSTNDKATAYIEYDYNGEHIVKYAEDNGRKIGDSKIHTIEVPYEHLSGNAYKVGATRVIDELSYGGRTGKTVESESITFNDKFGENISVLTVSDWHTHNSLAKEAASYLGDYNAVILLGDAAPGMMFDSEVANYILSFGGDLTHGEMPVLFARGNHETRGKQAAKLSGYLGIDKFYYTANLGDYRFIVLDSGEDKEDSHPEYGGMVDYEQNRKEMVNWLTSLENDGRKTVALSHAAEICIEDDLSETAHKKLDSLGVSFLASGHWHKSEFRNEAPYPVLIDGGIDAVGSGTYVASMLTLTPDGIGVKSVDNSGNVTVDENVPWRQ